MKTKCEFWCCWSNDIGPSHDTYLLHYMQTKTETYDAINLQVYSSQWRSWLRHCATSQKVAGSIPVGVIGIFHWHNPSGRTVTRGSTQPLTEMSTRNISWGVKADGAYGWPYHLHIPTVLKSGSLKLLEPSRPVMGSRFFQHKYCFTITFSRLRVSTRRWSFSFH